jgi:hypothetical protein
MRPHSQPHFDGDPTAASAVGPPEGFNRLTKPPPTGVEHARHIQLGYQKCVCETRAEGLAIRNTRLAVGR